MKIALVEKEKQLGEGWALDDKGNVTIYQSYILEVTFLKCSSGICDPLRENQPYAKNKNYFFFRVSYYLYWIYNRCKFEMYIFFFD